MDHEHDERIVGPDGSRIDVGFREVVERLPAIVYLERFAGTDATPGSMLYVSPQVTSILGVMPEEWIADPTTWATQFHPDDVAATRAEYDRALAAGDMFEAEYRMIARDGRVVWFRDEAVLIRDAYGTPLHWQGIMLDITAQRRGDERVREAERRYRTLVERLPAIVYSEDLTGEGMQVVYMNPAVEALLGISPEEWVADPSVWMTSIHPDDRDAVAADNARTEVTGEPFSAEYRMYARDGRIVWFRDEAVQVMDDDGRPAYWLGVMMDVTAANEAQVRLAEAEARYRTLVEQMPTVTYIVAPEDGGGTRYISPQVTALLGYTPEEWYDDPGLWRQATLPEDLEHDHTADRADEHSSIVRMWAKDGSMVWVHDRARLIRDAYGAPLHWQGVLVDVTQEKRAEALERDLATEREATERLREADDLKNTFLRAVSHDLRTPLAAILGLAATLERPDLALPEEESRELAGRIVANARRLDRMVTDMLDLDRLARGAVTPAFAPVDVGSLVRELVAGSELVAGRRLQLDTAPIVVPADAAMIERIVENLLGNTVKYTPGDSRIWVVVDRTAEGVMIAVEDDGPGVPEADRARIFEAFQQGPTPQRSSGVGVGLAVVARFAELHGGRAWVQEREGGGASFRVILSEAPVSVAAPVRWEPQADPQRTAAGSSSEDVSQE